MTPSDKLHLLTRLAEQHPRTGLRTALRKLSEREQVWAMVEQAQG